MFIPAAENIVGAWNRNVHDFLNFKHKNYYLSGTFLAERAMTLSYFKMHFHERQTIGYWCHMKLQKQSDSKLIWLMFCQAYMAPETTPAITLENCSAGIRCLAIL